MADLKLFKLLSDSVTKLPATSLAVEKSLQTLIEGHLETFLGVTFLASEFSTGPKHGGRIDTLGIDENGAPVIIEYKKALNANVINQGLFYLDWLLDHAGEFKLLVIGKKGRNAGDAIDWTSPRLICIAGDFTKYDLHAVGQMQRNIELIRYCRYGNELLALELVNPTSSSNVSASSGTSQTTYKTITENLAQADKKLTDLFQALKAMIEEFGDDVEMKTLKYYFAFRRIKNFACIEIHIKSKRLVVYVKHPNPSNVEIEGFARDVTNIGHYGTGNLELIISKAEDVERARPLIEQSYDSN